MEKRQMANGCQGRAFTQAGPIDTFTNPGTGAIIKSTQGKRIPFPYAFREKTAGESLGRRGSFHSGAAGEEPDGW